MARHKHPANIQLHDNKSSIDTAITKLVAYLGSVQYLMWQTLVVAIWIALNISAIAFKWDPYPFILLNLAFSTQAAYAAPLILLANNKQSEHDRLTAEHSYEVGCKNLELATENNLLLKKMSSNG